MTLIQILMIVVLIVGVWTWVIYYYFKYVRRKMIKSKDNKAMVIEEVNKSLPPIHKEVHLSKLKQPISKKSHKKKSKVKL